MVIDHDDLRNAVKQRRIGEDVRDMCIHHDEQRRERRDTRDIARTDKKIVIRLILFDHLQNTVNALIHIAEDDVDGFAERTRHACNAHRGPEAVIVLVVMPHDVDLVRALHDIAQRVRHDTCLDTRMLLDRLCLAAEELRLAADIECHLIAAAPEREVELCLRLLAELLQRLLRRERETDRERHGHPLRVDNLAHLVEDVKFLRNRMVK